MEEIMMKEKAGACLACSDFPTPHLPTYIFSTADAWLNDRVRPTERSLLGRGIDYLTRLSLFVEPRMLRLFHALSGQKVIADPTQVRTNRALVTWQEATRRNIVMQQLMIFGIPSDFYRASLGGKWLYFESLPIPQRLDRPSYIWIDDKQMFKYFLETNGIPAARASVAANLRDALRTFETFTAPVVVKPRIGSRARHTTPYVRTRGEFEQAFLSAQELCRYVLFEEHLEGNLCRATVVDGTLRGFLKKTQPSVMGNGVQTIQELVVEKNVHKHPRVEEIILGEEHAAYLRRQGYDFDSVLEKGKIAVLSRHSGRSVGGETHEMPHEIHPHLRASIEKVAQLLGVPVVGFDLIIPDPALDPGTQKWGILEANTLPFIELHYNPLYGKTSNIAAAIWDLWPTKSDNRTA